jgi:hypothetical protein
MAKLHLALEKLWKVEFGNNPDKFLHKNQGESGWTLGGVYQKANPTQIDWNFISKLVELCNYNAKEASRMLYFNPRIMEKVQGVFHNKYWSGLKLDRVDSQKIAEEIFLFAVLSGSKTSAKVAQRLIGVKADGLIGSISLDAINNYNEDLFDIKFDEVEIGYLSTLAEDKPQFSKFLNGWVNRSYAV